MDLHATDIVELKKCKIEQSINPQFMQYLICHLQPAYLPPAPAPAAPAPAPAPIHGKFCFISFIPYIIEIGAGLSKLLLFFKKSEEQQSLPIEAPAPAPAAPAPAPAASAPEAGSGFRKFNNSIPVDVTFE